MPTSFNKKFLHLQPMHCVTGRSRNEFSRIWTRMQKIRAVWP